ncbi:MAG: cytidylate kinase-like family protein [Armatimonadota bacterium]|nr:cytidylate kinase-like family protein [Armatimonadota bacterium]
MRITVTLARQLGCGGSSLGRLLAENLQIRCLDREIVSQTAQQLALDEEELAQREERVSSFWERMLRGITVSTPEAPYVPQPPPTVTDRDLFTAETEVMKTIAAQEDCVIVGRVASHVVPAHAGLVNIFLYAPLDFRAQRVMERERLADLSQARALIARSDDTRKKFIAQMTGREWGDAKNYDLCLDTSSLPLPEIADFVTDYIRRRIAQAGG